MTSLKVPPGTDSIQRVDMYARNTYIEFKRNLIVNGRIDPNYPSHRNRRPTTSDMIQSLPLLRNKRGTRQAQRDAGGSYTNSKNILPLFRR